MRIFLLFLLMVCFSKLKAQILLGDSLSDKLTIEKRNNKNDSLNLKLYQPTIYDYQYWKTSQAKRPIDTTLSLSNQYRYTQFNNQENFGKQAFNNIGQPFNTLIFKLKRDNSIRLLPEGKQQVYLPEDSVRYFDVKTPSTEFIYHNGMKEGQGLSTAFTHNINSQFNYALRYKGIRSLGHYLESEVDSRSFIVSTNYHTKNKRYQAWGHYAILNNGAVENAGIQEREFFISGDSNFRNRQRLLTNLTNARSKYLDRRYYIGQTFDFIKGENDSIASNNFQLKNVFSYDTNSYRYYEVSSNTFYEDLASYIPNTGNSLNKFNKILQNTTSLLFDIRNKFSIEAGLKYQNIKYFFDNPVVLNYTAYPSKIDDNRLGFSGNLNAQWSEKFQLDAMTEFMTGTTFKSTFLFSANANIIPVENWRIFGGIMSKSNTPSLNLLYGFSFYDQFNYYLNDFNNEIYANFNAGIESKKFRTTFTTNATRIENYTFLEYNGRAKQTNDPVQILQFGLRNQFQYKKFHIDSEWNFQTIENNENALPLPSFMMRANIFYKSMMFRNAANVQIGLKGQYFSSFASREYFPVMNEFKLQETGNEIKIGNYPMLDFYVDMRIKTMQIYLEAQHFNSFFTGYNYFATPNIPTFDFRLNIALVWYLFT